MIITWFVLPNSNLTSQQRTRTSLATSKMMSLPLNRMWHRICLTAVFGLMQRSSIPEVLISCPRWSHLSTCILSFKWKPDHVYTPKLILITSCLFMLQYWYLWFIEILYLFNLSEPFSFESFVFVAFLVSKVLLCFHTNRLRQATGLQIIRETQRSTFFYRIPPKNISDVWTLVLGCREDLRSGPCTGKICVADLKQLKIEVELIVLNRGNGHGPWAFLCEKNTEASAGALQCRHSLAILWIICWSTCPFGPFECCKPARHSSRQHFAQHNLPFVSIFLSFVFWVSWLDLVFWSAAATLEEIQDLIFHDCKHCSGDRRNSGTASALTIL